MGKSASFLVGALKDPIGANLDRVQIVKGWLDAKGQVHEKVYDVVCSDGRHVSDLVHAVVTPPARTVADARVYLP